ncbi:unnamed protein product [Amoebophrya sp. A120]|nr:unnamed protein product [Amoebophrya sp. A120]|eukprot:GSA120T00001745001.1
MSRSNMSCPARRRVGVRSALLPVAVLFLSLGASWGNQVRFLMKSTPACDCSQCEAAKRTDAFACGARSMCEPEPISLGDGVLCTVPANSVLMPGEQGMGVPKSKFCLNSCVPQQNAATLKLQMNALCSAITEEQMNLIPADPNGVDPACVIAHLESLDPDYKPVKVEGGDAGTAGAAAAATGAGDAAPAAKEVPLEKATEKDLEHLQANTLKTQATQLRLRTARAATVAEEAAAATQESLQATEAEVHKNQGAIAGLKSLLLQTKMYKQATWKAREETAALKKQMEAAAETAADAATANAKALVEKDLAAAQKLRDENVGRFAPTSKPLALTSPAAARAMAPYDAVAGKAKAAKGAHAAAAAAMQGEARQTQENAKTTLREAMEFHEGGSEDLAQSYHAQAVDMFNRAASLQASAEAHQAQAAEIASVLPGYAALSAHAALHADDRAGAEIPLPVPPAPPAAGSATTLL